MKSSVQCTQLEGLTAIFEKIPLWAPSPEYILNSLAVAAIQGLERIKASLFKSAHPSLLSGSTVCVPRRGSAQGKQTLIKSWIAHAFTSSLLIHWNKFQCVQFN